MPEEYDGSCFIGAPGQMHERQPISVERTMETFNPDKAYANAFFAGGGNNSHRRVGSQGRSNLHDKLAGDVNNGQNQFNADGKLFQYPSDLGGTETSHFIMFHIYSGHSQKLTSMQRDMDVLAEAKHNATDYTLINETSDYRDPDTGEILITAQRMDDLAEYGKNEMEREQLRMQVLRTTTAGGGQHSFNLDNNQELGGGVFWGGDEADIEAGEVHTSWYNRSGGQGQQGSTTDYNFSENIGQSASDLFAKSRKTLRGSRGSTKILKKETRVSKAQYRAKESIALYMPHKIGETNTLNWEMKDLQGSKGMGDFINGNVSGFGPGIVKKVGSFMDSIAGAVGMAADSEDYISAKYKMQTNPRSELLFQKPSQRIFSFEFDFAPRTAEESESVYDIIQTFKRHAYPSLSHGGVFYNFPSEFQLEYYKCTVDPKTGQVGSVVENDWLNRLTRCALTSIAVDYSPHGSYQTFENGAPTHIKLTLEFGEMELLHQQHILEGY